MYKRMFWLLTAVCLPLFVLYGGLSAEETAVFAAPYDVIINEWSQGDGGSREWVELVVVNGSVDLQSWTLRDGNSSTTLTFSDNPIWATVPQGTRILVYNGNDPDPIISPTIDLDAADCRLILPHDAAYFSGGWPSFSNSNSADNPHLRTGTGTTVHDFTAAPGSQLHPSGGENAQFNGNITAVISNIASWSNNAASVATPGTGNGGDNTVWVNSLCNQLPPVNEADLIVSKSAPENAQSGETIVYDISLRNNGILSAQNTLLTDTIPADLTYLSDDSGYPLLYSDTQTLVWNIGTVLTDTPIQFHLTGTIAMSASVAVHNHITATTTTSETVLGNNTAVAVTNINIPSLILIDALMYDGIESYDPDEAVRLWNGGNQAVDLTGWAISNRGPNKLLPDGLIVSPGEGVWLAKNADAFMRQFGFAPDAVLSTSSPPWPVLGNDSGEFLLLDDSGLVVDSLIYEDGDTSVGGWSGTAVYPYTILPISGSTGQILYRQRDQLTGLPIPDTNRASDWAQSTDDPVNGRKVRYPGWDFDQFFQTMQVTETAVVTIAIAPDNAYDAIVHHIEQAQDSIQIEVQTIENHGIGDALVAAQMRGVTVTMLLEGGVAFQMNKIPDAERYQCQRLESAGGDCYFMVNDSDNDIADRYGFSHAKFILIDGRYAIISSENLSPNSLPDDDKSDGTFGRRGVVLITDASSVITHLQTIFDLDLDLAHIDIVPWQAGTIYGEPPIGYAPITITGGTTYTVRFTETAVVSGNIPFEIVQSPENSLRNVDGLLGLINRAGDGDKVLVQQLNERPFWGASTSNPIDNPNPRLEAYINAARRGATVRIMLDGYFSPYADPNGNGTTCRYVNELQYQEHLNIQCTLENPAGLGIHNKMILVEIDGQGYVHVGSLNGSEQSSKGNREIALQFQSNEAFSYLAEMFDHDWVYRTFLPSTMNNYIGPASHILISEVHYNPQGSDDDYEFVELVNPTGNIVDLSNWSISDAVLPSDYEDLRHFPAGTVMLPHTTLVVATQASSFFNEYAEYPDFEIVNTVTTVPSLLDDPAWGDPGVFLKLGNTGDEVILRDAVGQMVDVMVYGDGVYGNMQPCSLVTFWGASLEREPYWRDTDICPTDFREQPFPTPNELPQ